MTSIDEPEAVGVDERVDVDELTDRIQRTVRSVVQRDPEEAAEWFGYVLDSMGDLCRRKAAMSGTKSETRDLLAQMMFSRLRVAMRELLDGPEAVDEIRAAEWIMGSIVAVDVMRDFGTAVDSVIIEGGADARDYTFAGKADFIGVEEVMQLLGGGKHRGCLSLEKADNRLDFYFDNSRIAFLDPHHVTRRVWPGATPMQYREVPAEQYAEAQRGHAEHQQPIILGLHERGVFHDSELREILRQVGSEVFFEFLSDRSACAYVYRRLSELPAFALEHDFRMPVTPLLLESNKSLDDWRIIKRVFPDPDAAIEPVEDMFAKLSSLQVSVLEIKILSLINGEASPRKLVQLVGLPLVEIYRYLVRFAKDGIVVPQADPIVLGEVLVTFDDDDLPRAEVPEVTESQELGSALDAVLGGEGGMFSGSGGGGFLSGGTEESAAEDSGVKPAVRPGDLLDVLRDSDDDE